MSDTAAHLFVLGVALLSVPIYALLGPWITGLLGGLCIVAAVSVYFMDDEPTSPNEDGLPSRMNCPECGARTTTGSHCEHCGADL